MARGKTVAESLGMVVVALALALSRRPPRVCFHGDDVRERRARNICTGPPRQRNRLFHRLGPPLEFFILASFLAFACIAIPLGHAIHFIEFYPQWSQLKSLPLVSLGILFFTAWPEEFLFRGLLQNILARSTKSDLTGWWIASIVFGLSHITNMGFPNWRYVILASIAGFFYG